MKNSEQTKNTNNIANQICILGFLAQHMIANSKQMTKNIGIDVTIL